MGKAKTIYICSNCAAEFSQWFGKCSNCDTYDSLVEQNITAFIGDIPSRGGVGNWHATQGHGKSNTKPAKARSSLTFDQISDRQIARWESGYGELDRVLGGGVVPGSMVLIGGDPGIGKSTLLLQVSNQLAQKYRILYVTGEESGQQVKLRASRLGMSQPPTVVTEDDNNKDPEKPVDPDSIGANLYILPETDLEEILREIDSLKPNVVVIDSIQTVFFPALTSAPGSVAQVRECTAGLMKVAKHEDITMLIVGHVTKEGAIAGPKVLEHLVDTVLYFEGDRFASHRLLRTVKNRFGATHEIGIFEMVSQGLKEVDNPSELFLGNRDDPAPGTAIVVACEGTRPIVVELQALVSPTSYPSPRRAGTGIDYNRLVQILAVLEKRVGIPMSKLDSYVASAGGLNVEEPAVDLGIAVAIVASFRDRIVDPGTVLIGEVGLGGQVRSVSQMELRLKEAAKLGFKRAIVPKGTKFPDMGIDILPVGKVIDAIIAAVPHQELTEEDLEPDEDE
ncbi:DNA repair protein RadA [Aphanizomenon flos-aquae NRERC-008]|jgi:DNA repair protein RadA/Sms|uniref:DNA repair protein RadA n=2 Tax=Aphanizomenon flos-aquae TaxID=1176 RepID=A0A1B7X5I3_APHFL|nr:MULTISPECIES: DNA repair protein RadA [Aphanizomenon]MBD1218855.1 DNA repair protein RadA [Aphanizomenon flos-aquae Clear-A1]MCE2905514.1 DNA repair protein RadA [Anabaena sp. CoA2_C59]MDJ0505667.1 DNA repair protein RadA [Nostocales cyanobacterium LE14-WE12]OBQ24484.1 MAG: DNA repair protein RadA [Anabaena sp. WA113]OBQ44639.1 MAG: DNA repair protein RadA [Aphanizomenon flos-aquae WA102]QSV67270.1 MAG: DNA repair protein RadA [Aphanizomenon flos-aquae DEX188]